jgi:molybdenum cofactor cytidylyltransferase
MSPYVEGVLLAAGESRRMGFPKPLLMVEGRTFIAHLCDTLLAELPHVLVVLGAYAEQIRAAIPDNPRLTIVENPNYTAGQLSSLKAAVAAVDTRADAILVHLADQPLIQRRTISSLLAAYAAGSKKIVVARYQGKRGHPVIFDRSVFRELMEVPDTLGARAVVHSDPERVACVEIDDSGVVTDFDFPSDLARAGLGEPPASAGQARSVKKQN